MDEDDWLPLPFDQRKERLKLDFIERDKRLKLAQSIYDNFKVGKRTAARMAIEKLGNWRNVDDDTTAIDYLRQRIVGPTIHSTPE